MPIQLVYNSLATKYGAFGYAWNCPQLESRIFPRNYGAEWLSPWGEKIRFYNKKSVTKDFIKKFKGQAKGHGCFSEHSSWESFGSKGKWNIYGKDNYKGWKFKYVDSRLHEITAPSSRKLVFKYNGDKVVSISENNHELVSVLYNDNKRIDSIVINGVTTKAAYKDKSVQLTAGGSTATRTMLESVAPGSLSPTTYSYDSYGFLSGIKNGNFSEKIIVNKDSGRIIQDKNLRYSYPADNENMVVEVKNLENNTATYKYDEKAGVLDITDFAGLNSKIYYFRRYDVAYNGKIRKIIDRRDRVKASYKYNKKTGNIIRYCDLAGNETFYTYDKKGNLIEISRSEEEVSGKRPLVGIKYDSKDNPVQVMKLDREGKDVWDTKYTYNKFRQVTSVSTAVSNTKIRYNELGRVTGKTDTFGNTTSYKYDKFNRLTDMIPSNGVCVTYNYDANSNINEIKRYKTCQKLDMLSSVKFTLNGLGQVVATTDNHGRVRKFDRDAEGQVIKEYFPDNTEVGYKYTKLGQLNTTIDPNGHKISFKWNKFGKLANLKTAVGQQAQYEYNKYGLLVGLKNVWERKTDRDVIYTYNDLDRLKHINFGKGKSKEFTYDSLGKITKIIAKDDKSVKIEKISYTQFDQPAERVVSESVNGKETSKLIYKYSYLPNGVRSQMVVIYPDGSKNKTVWNYDLKGRLREIDSNGKVITYKYRKDKIVKQTINNIPVYFTYTKLGQLEGKYLGANPSDKNSVCVAYLKYTYDNDGMITSRNTNGNHHNYTYDLKGQLLKVADNQGKILEEYVYDPAGNILKKTVQGKTTEYKYDKSNQLVSLTENTSGEAGNSAVSRTDFGYDAAGRMTRKVNALRQTEYTYGWMNKVMSISENGKVKSTYDYHVDGQVARSVGSDGNGQSFFWDGLALIKRGNMSLTNEPYVTGGNPVIAGDKTLFNDILGTTQGATDGEKFASIERDAFGQVLDKDTDTDYDYFTGKPKVEGLGYAFLFRNYNAGLGKWTTSDPLGYPDGWNNFAYCNNRTTDCVDWLGGWTLKSTVDTRKSGSRKVVRTRVTLEFTEYTTTIIAYNYNFVNTETITSSDGKTQKEIDYYNGTYSTTVSVERIRNSDNVVLDLTTNTTVTNTGASVTRTYEE